MRGRGKSHLAVGRADTLLAPVLARDLSAVGLLVFVCVGVWIVRMGEALQSIE